MLTRTLPSPLTSPGSLQRVPCGESSAESVEGRLERLQTAIVSKPGLWLQPEVAPVSTRPCRGSSLAANDGLAFPALSCRRPSPGWNVLRKQYLSTEGALLLDSQLQLQPGCFAMSLGRASIPGRSGSGLCLPAGVWVRGQSLPPGLGWEQGSSGTAHFSGPQGTLASKLFICLSACPSGLEGLACSHWFPKGFPIAGQL